MNHLNKTEYVLGFRFDKARDNDVVLIEKLKPLWQAGKLNGIGGKVEDADKANKTLDYKFVAMIREFLEETGVETNFHSWDWALTLQGLDWRVYVFRSFGDISEAHTMEKEEVYTASTVELPTNVIPNLNWMIPLLLDKEVHLPISIPY